MKVGELFDGDAAFADATWPFWMKTEVAPRQLMTEGFVVDFFVDRIESKPVTVVTEQVPEPLKPAASFAIEYVVMTGRNRTLSGQAGGAASVHVLTLAREGRGGYGAYFEGAHGLIV